MFKRRTLLIEIGKQALKASVAVVFALAVSYAARARIAKITSDLSQQKSTAFVLERRSTTIRDLQTDFATIGNNDSLIESAWPPADNVVDFKAAVDTLSARENVVQAVEFGDLAADQQTLSYKITLNANLETLIRYLQDFEKLPYFTSVSGIDFHPIGTNDWEGNSMITMGALVHTRPVTD